MGIKSPELHATSDPAAAADPGADLGIAVSTWVAVGGGCLIRTLAGSVISTVGAMTRAGYGVGPIVGSVMLEGPVRPMALDRDPETFWDDNEYALGAYVDVPPSPALIDSVEAELGYRLPGSYVALMRSQNGGMPRHRCCPAPSRTTWAATHVAVDGIMGIGRERRYSLAGEAGSRFWVEEWGYPALGVYFATCPSAGHDMIAFDYRDSGPDGEPRVVHVDQEWDYQVTVLAPNFVSFMQALRPESEYDEEG